METAEDFLIHYGVKGMKWGVRKDDDAAPTKRQLKAKVHNERADRAQAEIDRLLAKPHRFGATRYRANQIEALSKARDSELATAKALEEKRLTPAQRKLLIGATAAGAIVAAYATYKYMDSGQATARLAQLRNAGSATWRHAPKDAKVDPTDFDLLQIAAKVNPGYGEPGTKMNCRRATMAFEMRRRGYDVRATRTRAGTGQDSWGMLSAVDPHAPKLPVGRVRQVVRAVTDASKKQRGIANYNVTDTANAMARSRVYNHGETTAQKVRSVHDAISSFPVGARGELGVHWLPGGGHSMAWEMTKAGPRIIDAQSGKVMQTAADLADLGANSEIANVMSHVKGAQIIRLDDKPLNPTFLERWITHA